MLSIAKEKIDSLFELIGGSQPLYLPVDNNSGKSDFARWEKGVKLSENLKTTRSAKDFFFPKTEHMVSYEINGKEVKVVDPRKDIEDFVIFGVRSCDAKGFEAIDNVYLNMNPVDSYYKNRREHGTVITLACNEPEKTCFCSTFGIDSSLSKPSGDVSCWLADGNYYFQANTEKGKAFIEKAKSVLNEADDKPVESLKKEIQDKMEKLPFAHLDLSKFQGKDMLKIFNSKVWNSVAEACVGCELVLMSARLACVLTCATLILEMELDRFDVGTRACTTILHRWQQKTHAILKKNEADSVLCIN